MTIHAEKPSRHYIAKAVLCDRGYYARFSAPGLFPRLVTDRNTNRPIVFEYEESAEVAAMTALMGILNTPRQTQKRGKESRYQKLSGPEFAVLLAESGLGLSLFSWLYGTSPDRAQSWIDGTDNAPHPARILLELFKRYPKLVDIAEEITESVTSERRPR